MTSAAYHHVSVMRDETVAALRPRADGVFVDCTLGGGGHALALLEAGAGRVIGLDRDADAIAAASERLATYGERFEAVHAPFSALGEVLDARGLAAVDGLLADLGVSSHQLDTDARGFSFRRAGPIDMRMDQAAPRTAADLLDSVDERELEALIRRFGEERFAGRIARTLLAGRPWSDTASMAAAIAAAVPPAARRGRTHPATRTFQALRIAVNDELDELRRLLDLLPARLAPGGRAVFLTFHSLEDRLVKQAFAAQAGRGAPRDPYGNPIGDVTLRVLSSITPSPAELHGDPTTATEPNPRARSARLRVAERLPCSAP